jgi:hypothetical protein
VPKFNHGNDLKRVDKEYNHSILLNFDCLLGCSDMCILGSQFSFIRNTDVNDRLNYIQPNFDSAKLEIRFEYLVKTASKKD